ncbi:reverse transcriptase [Plakobranchus ocellatus]|uniref:Reverse transcriptase n=1 Tax=Plakobranchus ocellatus TaxID=259542 RepID=A0AAV4CRP4_9GAST|nr:reverse transcriptase [Plakobranchus ocellatus]
MYHVPEVIQVMLDDCFSGFRMSFLANDFSTNWINLEIGIAMGCTISPILFVIAMEVILKATEGSANPSNLGDACSMPPLKAFIDDTTIICSKEDETRQMLTRLDDLMPWCRMEFKPKKSRSLSIRKGKVNEATTFTVAEQQIPTVSQEQSRASEDVYDISSTTVEAKKLKSINIQGNGWEFLRVFQTWQCTRLFIPSAPYPAKFVLSCFG